MNATTLRIKEPEQFTVINDVGTKMGVIRRVKMAEAACKKYSWLFAPESRSFTHDDLTELAELVKKYDDKEPLKSGAPEEDYRDY